MGLMVAVVMMVVTRTEVGSEANLVGEEQRVGGCGVGGWVMAQHAPLSCPCRAWRSNGTLQPPCPTASSAKSMGVDNRQK